MDRHWKTDLEHWLAPFLDALGHKTRSRMCPAYVAGLIGAGDRKSIQPMAARDASIGYDQLHHFIASGVWDAAPLAAALLAEADRLVGGDDAWLIVDDTALPKKGTRWVGVTPQYASALGKNANCQTLVSLTLASGEVPVMVGLRLFLPESWTSDPVRMSQAGVPEDRRAYQTKPEIALEEIDRARAAGLRFGCVLADAGYGLSAPFRQGLSERSLAWTVGIPFKQKVYPVGVSHDLPRRRARTAAQAPCPRCPVGHGPGDVGDRGLAAGQLAARHQGTPVGPLRRHACARRRRSAPAHRRHGSPAPSRRGGLAHRRASFERRAQCTISPTFPPTLRSSALPARSRRAGSASKPTSN